MRGMVHMEELRGYPRKKCPVATAPVSPITETIHGGTGFIINDCIGASTFVY
jgi:hypothetical protein